ncbi:MAG: hypothetical protein KDM91_06465 [Verrucomicrobiae bacterium]|nr:hypothetical protein [Verrucomicrobiae bacterium]MCP5550149.1 hypothetical protein [Akkermansiaceae bacterium]
MSVNASRSRLAAVTKELGVHWRNTRERWRDAKSEEFERRYLEELFESVNSSLTVMEKLDNLIHKVRKDCE